MFQGTILAHVYAKVTGSRLMGVIMQNLPARRLYQMKLHMYANHPVLGIYARWAIERTKQWRSIV